MYALFQCVAEAVMAKGVRGLAEMVPGGGYLFDVASEAHKRLRDRKRVDQIRSEVVAIAAAGIDEVRNVAEQVVREVAKNAAPAEKAALELYLTQIPGAVRASFRRADDPSGKSVPDQFALADPADLARRLPSRLPHFRTGAPLPGRPGWVLGELLGSGGFGEVWMARNPSLAALKGAVKFGIDPQARERLLRHEGGLVSRVMEEGRHPNIVPLLDAYLEGETPWLMYEYVGGGDLGMLIHAWQALPPADRTARAVAALRTLAAAVGHFHHLAPPLVHRDLKPANILVGTAGPGQASRGTDATLRVADFGIGGLAADTALAAEASRRSSGYLGSQLWGSHTPLYASPQQQRGEKPDPRDDVHALGVIGFQMLTGKLDAAPGADFARTLKRFNVPDKLIELLGDCASYESAYRPKDAADLADKLGKLDPAAAPPAPAEPPLVTACPKCRVSLRHRAGATALRCVRCGHVFNPSAPPEPPPVAPPPPPAPAFETVDEPARETRRDYDRDRGRDRASDRDRPRRRDDDRRPPRGRGAHPGWIIGGVSAGVILLMVIVFVARSPSSTPVVGTPPPVIPTPPPPITVPPVGFQGGTVGGPVGGIPGTKQTGGTAPVYTPPAYVRPGVKKAKSGEEHPPLVQSRTFTWKGKLPEKAEIRYSPNGTLIMAVGEEGDVSIVSAFDGTERLAYHSHIKGLRPALHPDGEMLLTGLDKKGAWLVNLTVGSVDKGQELPGFKSESVRVAAFSKDKAAWAAAGGESGTVVAWRTSDNRTFAFRSPNGKAHAGPVTALAFGGGGFNNDLITAAGNTVRFWDQSGDWRNPPQTMLAGGIVSAVGFCGVFGRERFACTPNQGVNKWGDNGAGLVVPPNGALSNFTRAVVAGSRFDKTTFVAMTEDGKFGFWDGKALSPISEEAGPGKAADIGASKEGNLFAVGFDDGSFGIWNSESKKQLFEVSDHGAPVIAVTWSQGGNELATVDKTGRVRVWAEPTRFDLRGEGVTFQKAQ